MNPSTPVLVVEDDSATATALVRGLRASGFAVELATDGVQAIARIVQGKLSAVVLDLMLPERSGFEVLDRVQHANRSPVIVLTAKSALEDRMRAFELGAKDFVAKPFWIEEIVARLRVHTGVASALPNHIVRAGPVTIDLDAQRVSVDGAPLTLTATELSILRYLVERPGRAVSRRMLGENALAGLEERDERTVDSHLARLRKKLGAHASCIVTVWGIGYRFDPPETR